MTVSDAVSNDNRAYPRRSRRQSRGSAELLVAGDAIDVSERYTS